jgi:dihydropteroate synthase
MGIVNVTPDSFWDGGKYLSRDKAVAHALELAAQGAEILDIGGESTRPRATPVSEVEELSRVMPVIEALVGRVTIPISIDTMKPGVARAAIQAGASIVNDVAAGRDEDAMRRLVADSGVAYVCMHMQGTPQTMQSLPTYRDVVAEVEEFFVGQMRKLIDCGVGQDQIILDPGIGFGKDLEHNLRLLGALKRFGDLGRPVLLGVSRKSFMGRLLGLEPADRLPAALACTTMAVGAGVQIIRAHDVVETVQAVRMAEAILAEREACGR